MHDLEIPLHPEPKATQILEPYQSLPSLPLGL